MPAHESHCVAPPSSCSHEADAATDIPVLARQHACLTVGACGLSTDMARPVATLTVPTHHYGVLAASDAAPPSQIPPPDIPAPRA